MISILVTLYILYSFIFIICRSFLYINRNEILQLRIGNLRFKFLFFNILLIICLVLLWVISNYTIADRLAYSILFLWFLITNSLYLSNPKAILTNGVYYNQQFTSWSEFKSTKWEDSILSLCSNNDDYIQFKVSSQDYKSVDKLLSNIWKKLDLL